MRGCARERRPHTRFVIDRRPRNAGPAPVRALPPPAPRALVLVALIVAAVALLLWMGRPPESAPGSPGRDRVVALLDAVRVVPERAPVPGYERECSGASACVFGRAWSDTTDAPRSGNGCSTRHDVLARDLHGAETDPGDGCTVSGGVLVDPFSGRVLDLRGSGVSGVHVDHVFALSAAWDLGAWEWDADRRAAFANDVDRNLVAVDGAVNTRKGDSTPSEWLPPDPTRHCFYAARYLTAAVAYGLPVTGADHEALAGAVDRCPPVG